MVFIPVMGGRPGRRPPPPKPVLIAAALGGVVMAILVPMLSPNASRGRAPMTPVLLALIGFFAVAALVIAVKRAQGGGEARDDRPAGEPTEAELTQEAQRPVAILVVVALIAGLIATVLLLAFLPRQARAQGARSPAAYVMVRGTDTIIVERASFGAAITGDVAIASAPRFHYVLTLAAGPSVTEMALQAFAPNAPADAAPAQTGTIRFARDSVFTDVTAGGNAQHLAAAGAGNPLPYLNVSIAMTDLLIERARKAGGASYTGKFWVLSGPGVLLDARVDFPAKDSATVSFGGVAQRFALDADGRIASGAIPAQRITITRITGDAANRVTLGKPDYGAPVGAPYTAEEVVVKTPMGHSLSGTLTIPKGANGRLPAVVTITGSGQEDRDEFINVVPGGYRPFRQVADTLGRRGIAVLRLDDRGINGSGGDLTKATSADFADDIRAGVAYLRTRPEIDGARIALFGHSEGGMIGPMVASTDSKLAALVIFAGPAYSGRKILDFQLRNLVDGNEKIPAAKKDSARKAAFAQWDSIAAKSAWTRFFLAYDPLPTLRKVKVPTLILQGGTDQQVTPEQAPIIERTLKDSGNRDVTMRVFANRNHLFLPDSVGFPGAYDKLTTNRLGGDVLGPLADWLVLKLAAQKPTP